MPSPASDLIKAARDLSRKLAPLKFGEPVTHVYNPLEYAAAPHEQYLTRYGRAGQQIMFLGMNPGPYGMTQTGVPFGEIPAVRDWLGISSPVGKPPVENPKRPVVGFDCPQSEVSGRRLWGLFAAKFGTPDAFFDRHFVANYCPLVFMEEGGKNRTPDKLPAPEMAALYAACDEHLQRAVTALQPEWVIGVGGFAEGRALLLKAKFPDLKIGRVLHPSPASPAANKDWAGNVTKTMENLGLW
ncbi:uracil-DNA glycosylase family protein [Verrucomicrobium sp. BvORR106]|uniref:uracil-DNA glycosylase family protein n=1 Tax=Verrucomicrobium sp. BvORR106 TaxID=1403819 RepID=UPI00056F7406|nr:uracil-DNA glycosylase family protein [Verrucomicrobium sp. BvORR106]